MTAHGTVEILARDAVRAGHVVIDGLDVVAADARARLRRPQGFGVEVLQGAFTLWNQHTDPGVLITADLTGLSAGREGAPVRGSGIFLSGGGDEGGRLETSRLHTAAVYTDGGILAGTPGEITGGVFVVYGAHVRDVTNAGPVTTYGVNDMVLDDWGAVDAWTALAPVTSHGPSGIGFVNFGTIGHLHVTATIETFGQGARGFNIYDGTIDTAEFDRIVTHGTNVPALDIHGEIDDLTISGGIRSTGISA